MNTPSDEHDAPVEELIELSDRLHSVQLKINDGLSVPRVAIESEGDASPCGSLSSTSVCCISRQISSDMSVLTLDVLPSEIILLICSYLPLRFVIENFGAVCVYFNDIVNDRSAYLTRMLKLPQSYPLVNRTARYDDCNWCKETTILREEARDKWTHYKDNEEKNMHILSETHCGDIDAVVLANQGKLCFTGSRDRQIGVWNTTEGKRISTLTSHMGWVWCLDTDEKSLYSGSWDNYIKMWDLETLSVVSEYKSKAPVLALRNNLNMIFTGHFNKSIQAIDLRSPNTDVLSFTAHSKSILTLELLNENQLISTSDDNTIKMFDIRSGKGKCIECASWSDLILSSCYQHGHLLYGTKKGNIVVIDPSFGINKVQTLLKVHAKNVTGIFYYPGAIFSSGLDSVVNILEPNANPKVLASFQDHSRNVNAVAFQNDVLASVGGDFKLCIYA